MRNMGRRSIGAETVAELFEEVRQGMNPFATMEKRLDARIKGATIYPINASCELLLSTRDFCCAGVHRRCQDVIVGLSTPGLTCPG